MNTTPYQHGGGVAHHRHRSAGRGGSVGGWHGVTRRQRAARCASWQVLAYKAAGNGKAQQQGMLQAICMAQTRQACQQTSPGSVCVMVPARAGKAGVPAARWESSINYIIDLTIILVNSTWQVGIRQAGTRAAVRRARQVIEYGFAVDQ